MTKEAHNNSKRPKVAQSHGTTRSADPALYPGTAAAGDPPNTDIILGEYQATSENLP